MKDDSWKRFMKTGRIIDYLKYTACTSEEIMTKMSDNKKNKEVKEGKK